MSATTPQRMAFNPPPQTPGLTGCTGIARLGICIRCDRLYQAGPQMHPPAERDADRVWRCKSQVLDGVHVATVAPLAEAAQTADIGGADVRCHTNRGVPA